VIILSRVVIGGMFEPIAHGLRESGVVRVERDNAAHVFFTVRSDAFGLARPTDDGWAVEILVTDRTGGVVTTLLVAQLSAHFEGYTVSGPQQLSWSDPALARASMYDRTLPARGGEIATDAPQACPGPVADALGHRSFPGVGSTRDADGLDYRSPLSALPEDRSAIGRR
jgi:hypothetical protein